MADFCVPDASLKKTLRVLLVQPKYYSPFPPLPLLKLASWHRARGDEVRLVYYPDMPEAEFYPGVIYVTSLFTWTWKAVKQAVEHYRKHYSKAQVVLGGIYASLMPGHAEAECKPDLVLQGVAEELEDVLPAYDLVPGNTKSILFSSRGCIRKCPFCAVPKLEPKFEGRKSIKHLVDPNHSEIVLLDNNFLASPHWKEIIDELADLRNAKNRRYLIDFNQGLDARLFTPEIALELARLRLKCVRLAYDSTVMKKAVKQAIDCIVQAGIRKRNVWIYVMYNYQDTPEDFIKRVQDLMEWGVTVYPMCYQPVDALEKNSYVDSNWTPEQLDMVQKARRVLGSRGAWPPYEGLRKKFLESINFEQALVLRA